jgi:hypothetical protein|tara:strand:- start:333 stop:797 length:465 start_codon:yes stop_codon:yes gene_type:complete|eukprot:g7641.t1
MSSLAEESETLVPTDKLSVGDLGEGIKMVTQNTETGDGDGEETKDGKENGNDGGVRLDLESHHDKAVKEMEKLSKRLFYGGCFFLPFLWLLGIVYFWDVYRSNKCNKNTKWYISLSIRGFVLYTFLLIVWIITFQLNWTSPWAKGLLLFRFDNW